MPGPGSLCGGSTSTSRMVGVRAPRRRSRANGAEQFATELESFASHLVLENQSLQHENKQLNALLKEYEQTLENVMGKFRGVAVSVVVARVGDAEPALSTLHKRMTLRSIPTTRLCSPHCRRPTAAQSFTTIPRCPFSFPASRRCCARRSSR